MAGTYWNPLLTTGSAEPKPTGLGALFCADCTGLTAEALLMPMPWLELEALKGDVSDEKPEAEEAEEGREAEEGKEAEERAEGTATARWQRAPPSAHWKPAGQQLAGAQHEPPECGHS